MNAIETADDVELLTLHELDFEPEPECDYVRVECPNAVTWRVTCTRCGGWGLLCYEHMLATKRQQDWHRHRWGTRCPACHEVGIDLMRFDPIIAPDDRRLW